MKLKVVLLILVSFFISKKEVYGTHYAGSQITYQSLGNKKYKVNLSFYRECRGIRSSNSYNVVIQTPTGSNCNVAAVTRSFPLVKVNKVGRQNRQDTLCPPASYGYEGGFEEYVYSDTLDFGSSQLSGFYNICKEVYISFDWCCTNGAVTNYPTSGIHNFAYLNFELGANNSPVCPFLPKFRAACNQKLEINYAGVDYKDYDSLSYHIGDMYRSKGVKSSYLTGFSAIKPFTPYCPVGISNCSSSLDSMPVQGVSFSQERPVLIGVPTGCSESTFICIETREYRQDDSGVMQHIGTFRRETDLQIFNGSINKTPGITSSSMIGMSNIACEDSVQTTIGTFDSGVIIGMNPRTLNDTVKMNIPLLPENISFERISQGKLDSIRLKIKQKNGFNPKNSYMIHIEAIDNADPLPSSSYLCIPITLSDSNSKSRLFGKIVLDTNKNCILDSIENGVKRNLMIEGQSLKEYVVQNDGYYDFCFKGDTQKIGLQIHPFYNDSCASDTILISKNYKNYELNFLTNYRNGVGGKIWYDINNNCKKDINEESINNQGGYVLLKNDSSIYYVSDEGEYFIPYSREDTLRLQYVDLIERDSNSQCTNDTFVIVGSNETVLGVDFFVSTPSDFLSVKVNQDRPFTRPTNDNSYELIIKNKAKSTSFTNVTAFFMIDTLISEDTLMGNGFIAVKQHKGLYKLRYDSIGPLQNIVATFNFKTDTPFYNINSILNYQFYLDSFPLNASVDRENDVVKSEVLLRGPYDPNFKKANRKVITLLNDTLEYLIHFQNLGNDTAFNVEVRDTFNMAKYDLTTFTMLESSFPARFFLQKNQLHVFFDGIKLTDSMTSISGSKGWFKFRINAKDSFTQYTQILNRASIYFDFQPPVLTNYDIVEFKSPIQIDSTSISEICEGDSIKVFFTLNYPNEGSLFYLELFDTSSKKYYFLDSFSFNKQSGERKLLIQDTFKSRAYRLRLRDKNRGVTGQKFAESELLFNYKRLSADSIFLEKGNCSELFFEGFNPSSTTIATHGWKIFAMNDSLIYESNKKRDTFNFSPLGGQFILEHTIIYGMSCSNQFTDTLNIPSSLRLNVTEPLNRCLFESIQNPLPGEYKNFPKTIDAQGKVNFSFNYISSYGRTLDTITPFRTYAYSRDKMLCTAQDSLGCVSSDTADILLHRAYYPALGGDEKLCFGDSVLISVPYFEKLNYSWSNGDTGTNFLNVKNSGDFHLFVYDSIGCIDSVSFSEQKVMINDSFNAKIISDTFACTGIPLSLGLNQLSFPNLKYSFQWYELPSYKLLSDSASILESFNNDALLFLSVKQFVNGKTCTQFDSIKITLAEEIEFDMIPSNSTCDNLNVTNLNQLFQNKAPNSVWSISSIDNVSIDKDSSLTYFTQDTVANFSSRPGKYGLKVSAFKQSCSNHDSVELLVLQSPKIDIVLPDTVCYQNAKRLLFSSVPIINQGAKGSKWYGEGVVNDSLIIESLTDVGSSQKWQGPFSLGLKYIDPTTLCYSLDSTNVVIELPTELQLKEESDLSICELEEAQIQLQAKYLDGSLLSTISGDGILRQSVDDSLFYFYSPKGKDITDGMAEVSFTSPSSKYCSPKSFKVPVTIYERPMANVLILKAGNDSATFSNISTHFDSGFYILEPNDTFNAMLGEQSFLLKQRGAQSAVLWVYGKDDDCIDSVKFSFLNTSGISSFYSPLIQIQSYVSQKNNSIKVLNNKEYQIELYTLEGKLIQKAKGKQLNFINRPASGMYLLMLKNNGVSIQLSRVFVE